MASEIHYVPPIAESKRQGVTYDDNMADTTNSSAPAAVLWDMDGTIIDSEPYWIAAEGELVKEYGGTWTHEDALQIIGQSLLVGAKFLQDRGVTLSVDEIIERLIDEVVFNLRKAIPWQPGARELLYAVKDAGIPMALVTMSYRRVVEALMDVEPDLFDVVVCGDDVAEQKPHPGPYLHAAASLGVAAESCVAFEDSVPGSASAYASGARTVVIQRLQDVPLSPGMSRINLLTELGIDDVRAIANGRTIDNLVTTKN